MAQGDIRIRAISQQERCDVCHQADMFDPETRFCARCQHIALVKAIEQPKEAFAVPLPSFLARRLSSNVAIRCSTCGQFIMSRSPNCRHCGTYVRFHEAAAEATHERLLTEAFERLHYCKAASSLSWEFLRLHMWGFPFTLLLTPLTALGSLILFLRALWLSLISWVKFSRLSQADPRINEGRHQVITAVGKSAGAFGLVAVAGTVVVLSGLMAIPMFWDNYAKGQNEFEKRRFKEAEQLFGKAIEADPKNIDARFFYARAIWSQYVDDINADRVRNADITQRSITAFRTVLDQAQDLKTKDQVYSQIAEIYKVTQDRNEYEQWMLSRAALPDQTKENKVEAYVKMGTTFANDVTTLVEGYSVKNVYPRVWYPVRLWKTEDAQKVQASVAKAIKYLDR
ncbi:MAG: zinc ribbon domain-containing protein, partial [Acidobacteriota bacterium]